MRPQQATGCHHSTRQRYVHTRAHMHVHTRASVHNAIHILTNVPRYCLVDVVKRVKGDQILHEVQEYPIFVYQLTFVKPFNENERLFTQDILNEIHFNLLTWE